MSSPVEKAVDAYIRAANERDDDKRAALLEACWSESGRLVTQTGELRGRSAVAAMLTRFLARPNAPTTRVIAIDARGHSFRFRVMSEFPDGSSAEVFDAGQIDEDGRITTLLTFNGPLGDR